MHEMEFSELAWVMRTAQTLSATGLLKQSFCQSGGISVDSSRANEKGRMAGKKRTCRGFGLTNFFELCCFRGLGRREVVGNGM